MDDLSRVFEALANEHRRQIVHLLALQPRSISQLAQLREMSLPAIHRHVRVLEEAGLVRRRKVGRTNFLAIDRRPLRRLRTWIEGFDPSWGTEAETLENYAGLRQHPAHDHQGGIMKKFLFLAHGEISRTPEAMEAHRRWWSSIEDYVVDSGNPLFNGRNVTAEGEVSELRADMAPALGYSIVQARSIDEAVALLVDCPMDMWVYEAMPM